MPETRREIAFDHRKDHRQRKFQKAKIKYPGVAQLVARVVWERSGAIHDAQSRNAESLHNTGNFGLFPPPGTRRGIAFDHRNDHRQRNFQKAKIEYPGVAQLVARVVWERSAGIRAASRTDAGKPCSAYVYGLFPPPGTRRGIAFDHRNDHRQRNFQKTKIK